MRQIAVELAVITAVSVLLYATIRGLPIPRQYRFAPDHARVRTDK